MAPPRCRSHLVWWYSLVLAAGTLLIVSVLYSISPPDGAQPVTSSREEAGQPMKSGYSALHAVGGLQIFPKLIQKGLAECNPVAAASYPEAPLVFHPRPDPTRRQRSPDCKNMPPWTQRCCRTVYFLGSGKCGSTSLAMLLKHNMSHIERFEPESGFADGEKEPCWALSSAASEARLLRKFPSCDKCAAATGERERKAVLDGCPRYAKPEHARRIACADPGARFVMLVRDPLVRAISDHNDFVLRGSKKNHTFKEKSTLSPRSLFLSDYAQILDNFLLYFPPENILIVQMEALKDPAHVQNVLDQITSHYGVKSRPVIPLETNTNRNDARYVLPTHESLISTSRKLCPKTIKFFDLIGHRMNWMVSPDDSRLATYHQ